MAVMIDPALAPLVGSWRLLSASATYPETGERVDTFGPNPAGRVVVTAGGRIMFLIMRSDRGASDTGTGDLISYTGTVRPGAPGTFVTTVDVSVIASEIGQEKTRHFAIDGDRLTITLPLGVSRFAPGRTGVSRLEWVRE